MGVDHVACGPDTLYGDHLGMYKYWFAHRLGHFKREGKKASQPFPVTPGTVDPGYVVGLENPQISTTSPDGWSTTVSATARSGK